MLIFDKNWPKSRAIYIIISVLWLVFFSLFFGVCLSSVQCPVCVKWLHQLCCLSTDFNGWNPMYANRSLLAEQRTNRAAVAQVHAIDAILQKNRFMHCFDKFNVFSVSFSSKHEPDEVSYKHIRLAGCAWHVNSSWMK